MPQAVATLLYIIQLQHPQPSRGPLGACSAYRYDKVPDMRWYGSGGRRPNRSISRSWDGAAVDWYGGTGSGERQVGDEFNKQNVRCETS
jgi:hypothetical protein